MRPHLPGSPALALLLGWALLLPGGAEARQAAAPLLAAASDSAVAAALPMRTIGPAVFGGRISEVAVAPSLPGGPPAGTIVYLAAPTGGIWKSTNGGASWFPVFDDQEIQSMGMVAVAPSAPNVVWAGTGEPNNMRSSSWGNGVYRSTDGGATWRHMGLRTSQHIGRIIIHPRDPDRVFVASVGPLWASGGERGLFRTTDGGESWESVIPVDEHTGVTDVVFDPSDPDILYAATLQRQRKPWSYIGGGPGSGIWKSTDGGDSWTRLRDGLPRGDMGRIGLDVSRTHPRTVYAVTEGTDAGVYRSDDAGRTWRRTSDIQSIPWFFGQIRVDPTDPEIVYHLGVNLQRSTDGGRTWSNVGRGVHADQHALWINPDNPHHMILGNDGGLYISRDRAETWDWSPDLPLAQFYALGVDMAEPFFHVYGGTQDNGTWGGPSRTRDRKGIGNADWFRTSGGDGFYAAIDPVDHHIAYVESQNGMLMRYDRLTGETKSIRPPEEPGEALRYNWSAPILISPHDRRVIWFAANILFRSPDRGDSWERRSPDLTRNLDRDTLPMFGRRIEGEWVSRHQGTAPYGNIATLDESPLRPGLLITGSDDGVVAISRDGGATWSRTERFPGIPPLTYVSRVIASHHAEGRFYVALDGHRDNDFRPYILRTDDYGATWRAIHSNLPAFGSVQVVREHPRNPDLLFAGTEFAAYASVNGGARWERLTGGMPAAPVHDMVIHPRDNALVIATHGRGFWIIDDVTPLEELARARQEEGGYLFPVLPQIFHTPDGSPSTGTHGTRDYAADNPPLGSWLHVYLPRALPGASLEILDGAAVIRTLEVAPGPGLQRIVWDWRIDAPYTGPPAQQQPGPGGSGGGIQPPFVPPGTYTARLRAGGTTVEQPVVVRPDPNITLTAAEIRELFDLRRRLVEAQATLAMALRNGDLARSQLQEARTAVQQGGGPAELTTRADELLREVEGALNALRGGGGVARSVQQRLGTAAGMNRANGMMPTSWEREALESVPADLAAAVERLNAAVEQLPDFIRSLDRAGVPWTPGRPLPARTGG